MTKESLLSTFNNEGYLTKDEARAILELIATLKTPYPIVEIGVMSGITTKLMGHYLRVLNKPNKVYGIDPFIWKKYEDVVGDKPSNVEFIDGLSYHKEIQDRFPNISLLFIDGDHTVEAVTKDIKYWLPKVREVCVFHDYESRSMEHKVKEVVESLNLPVKHAVDSLGVLRINNDQHHNANPPIRG